MIFFLKSFGSKWHPFGGMALNHINNFTALIVNFTDIVVESLCETSKWLIIDNCIYTAINIGLSVSTKSSQCKSQCKRMRSTLVFIT